MRTQHLCCFLIYLNRLVKSVEVMLKSLLHKKMITLLRGGKSLTLIVNFQYCYGKKSKSIWHTFGTRTNKNRQEQGFSTVK